VHVDLDDAWFAVRRACGRDRLEERLPEGITAFGDAALAVDAQREAGDLRAFLEQERERVAAVGGVDLRRESGDVVVGVRAVCPLVGMGPDAELEVQAAARGFSGDEPEGFEVALALAGWRAGSTWTCG